MSFDQGLLERCLDTLRGLQVRVRDKNVFGMRGLMRGKTMFAAVGEASMIVKVLPAEYAAALDHPGVSAFSPGGEKLGNWVEVEADLVADDPDLRDWLETGLRAIR
jgi:TfoX/Sxy family transcriptional regulator of competence genes